MSDWIDIKNLKCENIDRKIIVKYENGNTSMRLVSSVFQYPWLFVHNAENRTGIYSRKKVITHYKEID